MSNGSGGSSDMAAFAVYVVTSGTNLDRDGGFPEVFETSPGSDTTKIRRSPGSYYIAVKAASGGWSVSIEDYQ